MLNPLPNILATLFLEPLPLDDYWLVMLVPLTFAIAVVYKAIKITHLSTLWSQAAILTGQILGFMALAALILWVVIEVM